MRSSANILSLDDARRTASSRTRTPERGKTSSRPAPARRSARDGRSTGASMRVVHAEPSPSRRDSVRRRQHPDLNRDANTAASRENASENNAASLRERLGDRMAKAKRSRAKEKAGKAFDRQFGSASRADASQAGPRAAVYKTQMGSSHRRAARMQQSSSQGAGARRRFAGLGSLSLGGVLGAIAGSRKAVAVIAVAACLALTGLFLYTPAQQYYHAVRERDQLQAELEAVTARNDTLESSVAYLNSEAGVEQAAREELGWVRPGEYSVYVQGLEGLEGESSSSTAGNIPPGSVEAPQTWYSPILDVVFGEG